MDLRCALLLETRYSSSVTHRLRYSPIGASAFLVT